MADILDFLLHDQLVETLHAALVREAPEGYARVDIHQLARADAKLWEIMATKTREGIRRVAGGPRPADVAFAATLDSTDFRLLLQWLPIRGRPAPRQPPRSQQRR